MRYLFLSLSKDIPEWWSKKSLKEQKAYLEKHPKSKMELSNRENKKSKLEKKAKPKIDDEYKAYLKVAEAKKQYLAEAKRQALIESQRQALIEAKRQSIIDAALVDSKKVLNDPEKEKELELIFDNLGGTIGAALLLKNATIVDRYKHKDWSDESYESWYTSLSKEEALSLIEYKGRSYEDINNYLRFGTNETLDFSELENYVKNIDSALSKASTDRDLKVFRGISHINFNDPEVVKNFLNHGIEDSGFVSVSTMAYEGLQFSNNASNNSAVMVINLPKGSKAGSIHERLGDLHGKYVPNATESELLLPRKSKIIPTSIERLDWEDQPPAFIVHAEVLIP